MKRASEPKKERVEDEEENPTKREEEKKEEVKREWREITDFSLPSKCTMGILSQKKLTWITEVIQEN